MTKKLNSLFSGACFLCLLFISILLAINSGLNHAVTDGISLWAGCVIPSLFPYLFITALLSHLKVTKKVGELLSPLSAKLFNCGGDVGYAFLMSVLSGYPLGAKIVCDLRLNNRITDAESIRASCLCSTSSPMFLISSVGAIMFSDPSFGIKLFICHLVCAFINGIIFSFYKRNQPYNSNTSPLPSNEDNILYDSVYSAVISVLMVGGLITVFYLLTEILLTLHILNPLISGLTLITGNEQTSKSIILGLFECTKGLKELSISGKSIVALPICASLCGFGGFSVIAQSLAYLKKAKIKTAPFLLSKVTSAVLNFLLGLIVAIIFG